MDGKLRNMTTIFLTKRSKILLLFRQGGRVVNNVWVGSAGGHFEKEELNDARACVLRELKEELGIRENEIQNLTLRYITLRRTKGEIRQNYYFFAELCDEVEEPTESTEGISKWFGFSELQDLEMPYSAKFVMEHYLKTGQKNNDIYVGVADGQSVIFTSMPDFG